MLFINNLVLYNNVILIKQDTIINILEGIEETQVKVLCEEAGLPDSLVKYFFMLLHDLLLVQK